MRAFDGRPRAGARESHDDAGADQPQHQNRVQHEYLGAGAVRHVDQYGRRVRPGDAGERGEQTPQDHREGVVVVVEFGRAFGEDGVGGGLSGQRLLEVDQVLACGFAWAECEQGEAGAEDEECDERARCGAPTPAQQQHDDDCEGQDFDQGCQSQGHAAEPFAAAFEQKPGSDDQEDEEQAEVADDAAGVDVGQGEGKGEAECGVRAGADLSAEEDLDQRGAQGEEAEGKQDEQGAGDAQGGGRSTGP